MRTSCLILIVSVLLSLCACTGNRTLHRVQGFAQGTTWQVQYIAKDTLNLLPAINEILKEIDWSVSTYNPESLISKINSGNTDVEVDSIFSFLFHRSQEVSRMTDGAFDITVAPLVDAYGFGSAQRAQRNDSLLNALRSCVGFQRVSLKGRRVVREVPCVRLDFNAIAQGYTVDRISELLLRAGISQFLIEVGGEIKTKGQKLSDAPWTVGIETPDTTMAMQRSYSAVLALKDRAMATSGNYRRFYEEDGKYFAHIIDPRTGESARSGLLSATVFADDCATADAFATAFTVMGLARSKEFLEAHPELHLDVVLIYREGENYKMFYSPRLKNSFRSN